jgi:D-serine deaminase-like pyridoxal phosphate-dependent protein
MMNVNELDTPVAVVDLDRLEANIAKAQRYFDEHHIAHRPHIKTHKLPFIAHLQMRAGAVGITCQKIGEAEVMADAGLEDIFLPYNIIGQAKLERLMRLARRVKLSVTADSAYTVEGYSEAAQTANLELPVLVEFDTGGKRCGVQSPQEAAGLAQLIVYSPGLRLDGLMTHPCNSQSDGFVRETKALLEAEGVAVERVSYGSTPGMWQAHTYSELHGRVLEYPEAQFYGLSEEHGHVDFSACRSKPEIGERVSVLPNHVCVVTNLFNQIVAVRGNTVEAIWPVAARGALQ